MTRYAVHLGLALFFGALALLILQPHLPAFGPSDSGPVILRVAGWGGPGSDSKYARRQLDDLAEFERQNPNLRVRMENIPGSGQYVPKLLMTYIAGNPPDVISLDASSAAVFIDNGLLLDLAPILRADPAFNLDEYFSNVVDMARRGDAIYGIPSDFTPMVIVYNKRLFDAAGVPYPKPGWTRAEFLATAQALTVHTDEGHRYGITFDKDMPRWFPWIWASGGDVLSPDGRHAVGWFDSPATIDALTFLTDLVRRYRVAPTLSENALLGVDLFRAGKAAMTMTGHWSLIEYRADGMDIGIATIPTTVGRRVTVMYANAAAISRASRHPEAAWAYIKFFAGEKVVRRNLEAGLAIAANRRVAMSFAGNPVEDAFLDAVRYARPPWGSRVQRYELVEDLGRQMMEDLLGSDEPVAAAAHRTAALIEADLQP